MSNLSVADVLACLKGVRLHSEDDHGYDVRKWCIEAVEALGATPSPASPEMCEEWPTEPGVWFHRHHGDTPWLATNHGCDGCCIISSLYEEWIHDRSGVAKRAGLIGGWRRVSSPANVDQGEVERQLCGGLADIAKERTRQIEAEGWTGDHDDQHGDGQKSMVMAAACYAAPERVYRRADGRHTPYGNVPTYVDAWPWDAEWDKRGKHDRRRQLVIAGALIVAELDRIDREWNRKYAQGGAGTAGFNDYPARPLSQPPSALTAQLADLRRENERLREEVVTKEVLKQEWVASNYEKAGRIDDLTAALNDAKDRWDKLYEDVCRCFTLSRNSTADTCYSYIKVKMESLLASTEKPAAATEGRHE